LPTLSSIGASLALPCFRFYTPLIEPDVWICRIRLSEKTLSPIPYPPFALMGESVAAIAVAK